MGAYQLSQLGVSTSREISLLFGLIKKEYQATFAVFKIQRPQGACVGWAIVDIYPKPFTGNDPLLVKVMAAFYENRPCVFTLKAHGPALPPRPASSPPRTRGRRSAA